tara:strand:- start:359 stop:790 length:432 start_codon:yes stop_codon:yes gene_type:complete
MNPDIKLKYFNTNYQKYINIYCMIILVVLILYLVYINFFQDTQFIKTKANIIDKECNYIKSRNDTNDMSYECKYYITFLDQFNTEHEANISSDFINIVNGQNHIYILYDSKNPSSIKLYQSNNIPIIILITFIIVFMLYNHYS